MFSVVKRYCRLQKSKTRIITKFYNGLVEITNREGIDLYYHDDMKSLNEVVSNTNCDSENAAVGIYRFSKHIKSFAEIHLLRKDEYNVHPWTFAHELGHHFSIRKNNDRTEKAADNYILKLAEEILNENERLILKLELHVYSDEEGEIDYTKLIKNMIRINQKLYYNALIGYIIKKFKK